MTCGAVLRFEVSVPHPIQRSAIVNRLIWLVGAVVIILFILGYFGLR
jgi:hypothetical protein